MRTRSSWIVAALAALAFVGGCSSSAEDSDDSAGAITPAEAAARERFDLQELIVSDRPASPGNVERLGIKAWTVYAVGDAQKNVVGTVAYATDPDGDVKYAVATASRFDGADTEVALFAFAKNGDRTTLDGAAFHQLYGALEVDVVSLRGELDASLDSSGVRTQAVGSGVSCALRVAAIGLGAAAIGLAAGAATVVGTTTWVVGASTSPVMGALVAYLVAPLAGAAAIPAAVGAAATFTLVSDRARRVVWTDTVKACKSALARR